MRRQEVIVKKEPETNTKYYVEVDNPDSAWACGLNEHNCCSVWHGLRINWLTLSRQKLELLAASGNKRRVLQQQRNHFDSVVNLIDEIQHMADSDNTAGVHPVVWFSPLEESAALIDRTETVGPPTAEDFGRPLERLFHDLLYESPSYSSLMKIAMAGLRRAAAAEKADSTVVDLEESIKQLQEENANLKKKLEEKEVVNGYAAVTKEDGWFEMNRWTGPGVLERCLDFINKTAKPEEWLLFKIGAEIPLETKTVVKVEPRTEGGN